MIDPHTTFVAGVQHVHLHDQTSKPNWLRVAKFQRTSDSALVYCQGKKSKNHYLIIALLRYDPISKIGAHERAKKTTFMLHLAEIAEGFREKY